MDQQAANLLSALKRPNTPSEAKLNLLNALKSDIKHCRVPETAHTTIFECLRLAIAQHASATLATSAVSALCHLIKRLKIQDASGHAITQLAPRLFPALQEKLGDLKEPMRASATQALIELHPFCSNDVEFIVREEAIGGSLGRAKEAGIHWVVKMHKEESMPFKSFVGPIVARLEDSDGNVRETAKHALVELFSDAPDRAKTDLKKQLKAYSVRVSLESYILTQIGASSAPRPGTANAPEGTVDLTASTRSLPTMDHAAHFAGSISSEAAQPPPQEVVQMDPLYMHSQREVDDMFRDILPHFDGKETEQNWMPRDKSVLKLRRLLKGNAPSDYHQSFMAGIKTMLEGVLKVANSLRTTMSTNGCQLIQELARTLGPALDAHVEILLQNTIKMTATTKHIAAENGRITTDAIFQHCTYGIRLMQHIWSAAQEKNVQTRQCAPEWLRTILKRQAGYRQHFESSGALELAEKCIRKGLDDANPKVKEGMRATYWTFAKSWPDHANAIMSKLDAKSRAALERDSNNPNAFLQASQGGAAAPSARPGGANSRLALREMLAEQRKTKASARLPERPVSAMATLSPSKSSHDIGSKARTPSNLSHSHRAEIRVVSTTSTASENVPESAAPKKGSSLMSGPVRRPRRPEIARPQTADPYASRRLLGTPSNGSPTNSPPKDTGRSKPPLPNASASRTRAKTAGNIAVSPAGSPAKHSPRVGHVNAQEEQQRGPRPSRKEASHDDNTATVREDDLTMVVAQNRSLVETSMGDSRLGPNRPPLGQTMSVDSGLPSLAEDDGFTMVLPSALNNKPRARSPLAYRSPLKAMFEEARGMLDRSRSPPRLEQDVKGINERLGTGSPRRESPMKPSTPQPTEVQVYEDPFIQNAADRPFDGRRTVLGELPVNENVTLQSPTQSQGSGSSTAGSPHQASNTTRSPASSQNHAEVVRSRRLLSTGIERIRARTLDAHGFRRLQDLSKSSQDIWAAGKTYDELLAVLLSYLQTFTHEARPSQSPSPRTASLPNQAVTLLRVLMTYHPKSAAPWDAKALVTLLRCHDHVEPSSHLANDLSRAINEIISPSAASPGSESCISAILDHLATITSPSTPPGSTAPALQTLRLLLLPFSATAAPTAKPFTHTVLGTEQQLALAHTTARYLEASDSEVRKATVELASEVFGLFDAERKRDFWAAFRGVDEGRLGLLTYYIARSGRAGGMGGA